MSLGPSLILFGGVFFVAFQFATFTAQRSWLTDDYLKEYARGVIRVAKRLRSLGLVVAVIGIIVWNVDFFTLTKGLRYTRVYRRHAGTLVSLTSFAVSLLVGHSEGRCSTSSI